MGYSGLGSGSDFQKEINSNKPIPWESIYQNPVQINLTSKQIERALPIVGKLGIPNGQPFICLYVRDAGFEKLRTTENVGFANANIKSFVKAALTLIEKGYKVVRVGDPTMVPIEVDNKGFVDYVHTPHYSELADLYLYRHCAFWLGTMGGGSYAAPFYNRSSVMVNVVELPYCGCLIGKYDIFIPKHIYSVDDGRFLSLREQLQILRKLPPSTRRVEKYIHVENTEDEIGQVVKEKLESITNANFDWNRSLQSEYHQLRQKATREIFYNNDKKEWCSFTIERYQHVRPKVGKKFLEDCWEYSGYLKALSNQYDEACAIHA